MQMPALLIIILEATFDYNMWLQIQFVYTFCLIYEYL